MIVMWADEREYSSFRRSASFVAYPANRKSYLFWAARSEI